MHKEFFTTTLKFFITYSRHKLLALHLQTSSPLAPSLCFHLSHAILSSTAGVIVPQIWFSEYFIMLNIGRKTGDANPSSNSSFSVVSLTPRSKRTFGAEVRAKIRKPMLYFFFLWLAITIIIIILDSVTSVNVNVVVVVGGLLSIIGAILILFSAGFADAQDIKVCSMCKFILLICRAFNLFTIWQYVICSLLSRCCYLAQWHCQVIPSNGKRTTQRGVTSSRYLDKSRRWRV